MFGRNLFFAFVATISAAANGGLAAPCADIAARLPNVNRDLCDVAKLQPTSGRSVKGRTLWLRDVNPGRSAIRVLVVGAIHGDELSSASVAMHWIKLAGKLPAETQNGIHWRFIPILNPDGVFSRKPQRGNANGVDLNRNFPTANWAEESKDYWERRTRKDPRRWPGHKPLSEPESRFLFKEMADFKPNLIVSIHAPYGVLDFDGPSVPPSRLGRLHLDQVGIFPGSLGNYGGLHKGVPVVTIELPSAGRTPKDAEISKMWGDLLAWMRQQIGPAQQLAIAPTAATTAKRLP